MMNCLNARERYLLTVIILKLLEKGVLSADAARWVGHSLGLKGFHYGR
jgi:hypothetical protein